MSYVAAFFAALTVAEAQPLPVSVVAEQLQGAIVENGYRRVGVLPQFIVRQGADEKLGGSLGPQGDLFAEQLGKQLLRTSQGKYRVIDDRQMRAAFAGMSLADLGKRESLLAASKKVGGMDGLVVGTLTDLRQLPPGESRPELDVEARLIDVRDSSAVADAQTSRFLTLSDAAYMGESWELRRWTPGGIVSVGLDPKPFANTYLPFAPGPYNEENQYRAILRNRPHPLVDSQCPYRMSIVVDGQQRPWVPVKDRFYVALEPGDTYQIRVESASPRPAYLSLFVDGINILGKTREHPSASKFWHLAAGQKSQFAGWTTGSGGQYKQEEFIIAPADSTVAAGQGFGQQLGMITAVYYTVGLDGLPEPPAEQPESPLSMTLGASMADTFGTGAGRESELTLEEKSGPERGIILAAMTIYYAPSAQVDAMKQAAGQ
ncbi:MAG: hypothetical protein HUU20_20425 [Pirellulales bacterium]|nr:hypothetical protein [Pirellulales bacterium]